MAAVEGMTTIAVVAVAQIQVPVAEEATSIILGRVQQLQQLEALAAMHWPISAAED